MTYQKWKTLFIKDLIKLPYMTISNPGVITSLEYIIGNWVVDRPPIIGPAYFDYHINGNVRRYRYISSDPSQNHSMPELVDVQFYPNGKTRTKEYRDKQTRILFEYYESGNTKRVCYIKGFTQHKIDGPACYAIA